MREETKIAVSVLCILCIAFFLLFLFIPFIKSYIYMQGYDARMFFVKDLCAQQKQADILLIGSSTTIENINGGILETTLQNKTVYNLGMAGIDPVLVSFFTDCFIAMKPSVVIYSFVQSNFVDTPVAQDRETELFSLFTLFYNINDSTYSFTLLSDAQKDFYEKNSFEKHLFLSKYGIDFLFNGFKFFIGQSSFEGYKEGEKKYHDLKNPTFVLSEPVFVTKENSAGVRNEIVFSADFNPLNNNNLEALQYLVDAFKEKNITLILLNTPLHPFVLASFDMQKAALFDKTIEQICQKNCVYLNKRSLFLNNASFFIDHVHLSNVGENMFTEHLASALQTELK